MDARFVSIVFNISEGRHNAGVPGRDGGDASRADNDQPNQGKQLSGAKLPAQGRLYPIAGCGAFFLQAQNQKGSKKHDQS